MTKKILAFLMILALLCGCANALADEATTVYASDFTKDNDGWYGRGAQSFRTTDATLKTIGRQSAWNSPGRDFDLIESWVLYSGEERIGDEGNDRGVSGEGGVLTYETILRHGGKTENLRLVPVYADGGERPEEAIPLQAQ
jgi:hypothetical protein